jgi:hypothetical protein
MDGNLLAMATRASLADAQHTTHLRELLRSVNVGVKGEPCGPRESNRQTGSSLTIIDVVTASSRPAGFRFTMLPFVSTCMLTSTATIAGWNYARCGRGELTEARSIVCGRWNLHLHSYTHCPHTHTHTHLVKIMGGRSRRATETQTSLPRTALHHSSADADPIKRPTPTSISSTILRAACVHHATPTAEVDLRSHHL